MAMKRLKSLIPCCLSILFLTQLYGQKRCGTDMLDAHYRMTDPDYAKNRMEIEQRIQDYSSSQKSASLLSIPVVVHVLYRTAEQNISAEQVQSQIDVLNKDFNKLNWDTMKVPSIWKKLIADCEISFVLANRDVQGKSHPGITRTEVSTSYFIKNGDDSYCLTSKGGHDSWDRDSYLNIWVGEVKDSLYGFASYPGAPAYCDGVAIAYKSFGTTGTAEAPTHKGRTATHEVGHWFNLQHLWGNTSCGDDGVSDTPIQEGGNFDCPGFPHVSCSNGPAGDMFMNFMDWTDDPCLNMFTEGQKLRMTSALNTSRSSLFNSKGYNGYEEYTPLTAVKVGPNPASSNLRLTIPEDLYIDKVELTDVTGRVLKSWNFERINGIVQLDLADVDNGFHLLRMSSATSVSTRKLLIQDQL